MQLSVQQISDFQAALTSAFISYGDIEQLTFFGLGQALNSIVAPGPLPQMVFDMIRWSNAQDLNAQLLDTAVKRNPGNPKLKKFAQQMRPLALQGHATLDENAEAFVRQRMSGINGFLDLGWLQRAEIACQAVCRVETPTEYGTGFLVGPNLVMTNYHVMKQVIEGVDKAQGVVFRFDYAIDANGKLNEGTEHRLANTWRVASSENSPTDPTKLDYVLMQTEERPGEDEVAPQRKRGWLKPQAHIFQPKEDIFILQHPRLQNPLDTEPLKIVLAPEAVTDPAYLGQRVLYQVNTNVGASGSPCFTANWDLVALHRANNNNTSNEGVSFRAILDSMSANPAAKAALGL